MACFDVEAPIVCIAINQTIFLAFVLRSGSMGKLQRLEEILRYVITVRFTTDSLDYFAKDRLYDSAVGSLKSCHHRLHPADMRRQVHSGQLFPAQPAA